MNVQEFESLEEFLKPKPYFLECIKKGVKSEVNEMDGYRAQS